MKELIKFEPGIREIKIKRVAGFKKLQLMAARINKGCLLYTYDAADEVSVV
jgi:hypothetical protein